MEKANFFFPPNYMMYYLAGSESDLSQLLLWSSTEFIIRSGTQIG